MSVDPPRPDLPGCLLLLALGAVLTCAAVASAQRTDPGLLLARTCVAERGWRVETDDEALRAARSR